MHELGDAVRGMFRAMAVAIVVAVPLAVWKAVEIVMWLLGHLTVTWG